MLFAMPVKNVLTLLWIFLTGLLNINKGKIIKLAAQARKIPIEPTTPNCRKLLISEKYKHKNAKEVVMAEKNVEKTVLSVAFKNALYFDRCSLEKVK